MSVGKPMGAAGSALTHSTFLPRWKASVTCWSSTTECGAGRLSLGSPSYGWEEAAFSALRSHDGRLRPCPNGSYQGEASLRGGGGEAAWIQTCRKGGGFLGGGGNSRLWGSTALKRRPATSKRRPSRATSRTWTPMSLPGCQLIVPSTFSARAGNSACQRSEEHTSELQSRGHLVCRLLLEK